MKVKKFVKLAENIPIVLSFRGYEVVYKAGKMITDEAILNCKITSIDTLLSNSNQSPIRLWIDELACKFKSIEPPEPPEPPTRYKKVKLR